MIPHVPVKLVGGRYDGVQTSVKSYFGLTDPVLYHPSVIESILTSAPRVKYQRRDTGERIKMFVWDEPWFPVTMIEDGCYVYEVAA